jgi:NADPH2:quinone reductase
MKEVIVHVSSEATTEIHEIPIPVPGPDEVVIKVIVAGSNPKGLFTSLPFIGSYVDIL